MAWLCFPLGTEMAARVMSKVCVTDRREEVSERRHIEAQV